MNVAQNISRCMQSTHEIWIEAKSAYLDQVALNREYISICAIIQCARFYWSERRLLCSTSIKLYSCYHRKFQIFLFLVLFSIWKCCFSISAQCDWLLTRRYGIAIQNRVIVWCHRYGFCLMLNWLLCIHYIIESRKRDKIQYSYGSFFIDFGLVWFEPISNARDQLSLMMSVGV